VIFCILYADSPPYFYFWFVLPTVCIIRVHLHIGIIQYRVIAFLLQIRYVTLWPWPLTFWPSTAYIHGRSRGQPCYCHQVWISCVYSFLSYELLAEAPSALGTLGASARFMIQDFQQSTMAAARRWEGSAFTNALEAGSETAGKTHRCRFCSKLCGVGPACQHTHTHTDRVELHRWPAASLQSIGRCATTTIGYSHSAQIHALSFETSKPLSPLWLHRGIPGSTPTHMPIHRSGRRQRCADGRRVRLRT